MLWLIFHLSPTDLNQPHIPQFDPSLAWVFCDRASTVAWIDITKEIHYPPDKEMPPVLNSQDWFWDCGFGRETLSIPAFVLVLVFVLFHLISSYFKLKEYRNSLRNISSYGILAKQESIWRTFFPLSFTNTSYIW